MKKMLGILTLGLSIHWMQAQTGNATSGMVGSSAMPTPTSSTVISRDANSALWQRETYEKTPDGAIVTSFHHYVELATGLNFKNPQTGQWQASKEEIAISPDGSSASAINGQHQIFLPGDIFNGAVKLVTPDGKTLRSQPIGLIYSDGSNSVLLAVVTNSTGAILPSGNQVIYQNAFAGLKADLIYTYTKAGMEQDVVLREQPPDPQALGLDPQETRLQVVTEFLDTLQPSVRQIAKIRSDAGDLEDDNLSFGMMTMGRGKAFLVGADVPSVDVAKHWLSLNGRQFLVKEIPIVSVAKAIDTLPPFTGQAGLATKLVVAKNLTLPPQRLVRASPKTVFLAQATPPSRGLVSDYVTVISQTNYTFHSDMTYYISGVVNLSGTNTVEGGAVLKYAPNATMNIAAINCLTGPYRPVYFTGKDDDRAGEWISGTTHNPTGYYANPALTITASGQTLSNFRIAYARQAVSIPLCGGQIFLNGQIVNCQNGFWVNYGQIFLKNVLFAGVQTNFNNLFDVDVFVQNSTFCSNMLANALSPNCATLVFTNCIFANVNTYSANQVTLNGYCNGFYPNYSAFGSGAIGATSFPFQRVGAADYYLPTNSPFHKVGTPNLDPILATDLASLTT